MNPRVRNGWIALASALTLAHAAAQTVPAPASFPTRAVTLVVPFPAGGPSDALARAVAQPMGARLGQPVVIENVGGAGGTIGLTKVAKSPADGHTLGFGTIGTHVANVALYKKLPYDPLVDFQPVGLAGLAPLILVARPNLAAGNLTEFVAWLRSNPGKVSYGSAGVGSISHFACVMLLSALKLDVTHVPYRGVAPAMNDLMGGQIDFMCDQTTTALGQVAGGKIKALAVLSNTRLPQLPQLATAQASGYPDVNVRSWNALFAPKGTPAAVMQRLTEALAAAVADPALRQQLAAVGVDLPSADHGGPSAVTALIEQGLKHEVPALKARVEYLD